MTPEILARYVSELKTLNASSTAASHIGHLYMAMSVIAPAHDWRWMRHAESRLRRSAIAKDKRSRLVPSDQLFSYGLHLMAEADAPISAPTFNRALLFRDGLMVALLAALFFSSCR